MLAGAALFIGSFIFANTLSMLVAQRSQEMALLIAIGATRAQVMRVVLDEAVLIGSVLGIGLGRRMPPEPGLRPAACSASGPRRVCRCTPAP